MSNKKVLQQIQNGELTSQEALNILYPEQKVRNTKPGKRASFIKMKIHVPDEGKGVNTFLKILFAIPIPMIFVRMGLRIGKRFIKDDDKDDFDINEISKLLKYSKNTQIQVESTDATVDIRII
ncbi:hypothetical protein KQ51_00567 [Candidatus Izimaplasma bacterium HR1]|jgi:predicted hydrocarbon binding protein|uniref:hypothetical protein n=1 Tax=Candidatus Izimoplasma sp. HR1 TaxID=1541959 RepID=UPI0004F6DC43|nr:hypothetical protein KQ51_00567 [Candidatus Izimaplasma bacterium HR1]